jgi:hypothetical protein
MNWEQHRRQRADRAQALSAPPAKPDPRKHPDGSWIGAYLPGTRWNWGPPPDAIRPGDILTEGWRIVRVTVIGFQELPNCIQYEGIGYRVLDGRYWSESGPLYQHFLDKQFKPGQCDKRYLRVWDQRGFLFGTPKAEAMVKLLTLRDDAQRIWGKFVAHNHGRILETGRRTEFKALESAKQMVEAAMESLSTETITLK